MFRLGLGRPAVQRIVDVESRDRGQALKKAVDGNAVIPTRYHYSSESLARIWEKRSSDAEYQYGHNSTEFWGSSDGRRFAELVRAEVKSDSIDFVSLGPGDGVKDASIMSPWLTSGVDLLYYAYDVSIPLASLAIKNVRETVVAGQTNRLRDKAVIADFHKINQLRVVFDHRPETPNVYSFLGTLGNLNDDVAYLRKLRAAMSAHDLLLLEVRLKSDWPLDRLAPDSSLQHDFGPLKHYFGLSFDQPAEAGGNRVNC